MNIFLLYDNFYVEVINVTMGERIKAARKRAGLTQEQLAKKCEIATITIGQYERNKREPNIDTIFNLSEKLGVSVSYLLGVVDLDGFISPDGFADPEDYEFIRMLGFDSPEKLATLVPGARQSTLEHRREIEKMMGKEDGYLDKMSLRREWPINQQRLVNAFDLLNDAGQQKAIERVDELTEIPKYKRQPPQEPSAAPSEGTDTTPAENAATEPPEGK